MNKFSDLNGKPTATHVAETLEQLFEDSEEGVGPEGLKEALKHHMSRLSKNHNMEFWKDIVWFDPIFISEFGRPYNMKSISVQRANNLFDRGLGALTERNALFSITDIEWQAYVTCTDFEWDPSVHSNEYDYWCTTGDRLFPLFSNAARRYVWTPPLVTKCDSWLSILSYMYCPRQSRLPPRVIADRIFLRGNLNKIKRVTHSPKTQYKSSEEGEFDLLESRDTDEGEDKNFTE